MLKKIFTLGLFILCTLTMMSQSRREERMKEKAKESSLGLFELDADDIDFKQYNIPDSFRKSPAVILCKKIRYACTDPAYGSTYSSFQHLKLVINEKSALEDFSTIYFDLDLKKGEDKISIRILKKGGSENTITGVDAIKVNEGNVPRVYRSAWSSSNIEYYKMAIPDLEVGDTLEYFLEKRYKGGMLAPAKLPNLYYFVNSKYPIVKQKVILELAKVHFLTARSVYGAPTFKSFEADGRKIHGFMFEDMNRGGVEDERWLHDARELPHVKFQVVHANERKDNFASDDVEKIKSSVTREDMEMKFNNIKDKGINSALIFAAEYANMKDNYKDVKDGNRIVELMYNYFRAKFREYVNPLDDEYFTGYLFNALQKYDVEVEMVAVPHKLLTDNENLTLTRELIYGIKFKDKFIFPSNCNSNVFDRDKNYDGQKGYVARFDERARKVESVKEITLPSSSHSENTETNNYYLALDESNFDNIKVVDTCYYTGMKKREYNSFISRLAEINKKNDDRILYKKEEKEERQRGNEARREEEKRKKNESKLSAYEEYIKELKESYEDFYPKVVSIDTFLHLQTGTKPNEPVLSDKTDFTLTEMTKKVGPNYVIEIGKIIGSQTEIKGDEKKRIHNIWVDFPKELHNNIVFKIPPGYTAEGLENFNFNIDNEAGKFISTAKQEGNAVVIKTTKIYKSSFLPKSQWPNMVAMLDAAYNFTQKQLILKK